MEIQAPTVRVHKHELWVCFFLGLVLCITMSGCFPYHYTMRPGLSGDVVSEESHKPLTNAAISFVGNTNIATVAFSAEDGSFTISPERKWGIWIIPQDVFALPYTVCVHHAGYETNYIKFRFSFAATGKASTRPLGTISLKPLPQQ